MTESSLFVSWEDVLAESVAENERAFQELESVDWNRVIENAAAENERAFQELESVDWKSI